jgi:hypothetical protein
MTIAVSADIAGPVFFRFSFLASTF